MTISLNGSGGITYPDGTVNTTRSVSTAGDTMTGTLNVPALNVTSTSVGVGITTPTLNSNGKTVHIHTATNTHWSLLHTTTNETGSAGSDGSIYGQIGLDAYVFNYEAGSVIIGTQGAPRLTVDLNGRMTMPAQPTFSISSMTHVASSNWNGGTVLVNKGGFTYNSSTGVITVPSTGTYLIHAHMLFNNANQGGQMILRVNGGFTDEGFTNTGSGSTYGGLETTNMTLIRNLSSGDSVACGASGTGWYTQATGNVISIVLLN